jgi:circadian clock protein KaiB
MKKKSGLDEFEDGLRNAGKEVYVLKLYITGMTPNSQRAVENIKNICEQYLKGRYELEIIDIYQQPALAQQEQIIAAPTLVKSLPAPIRKLIGDMSNKEKIIIGLNLKES